MIEAKTALASLSESAIMAALDTPKAIARMNALTGVLKRPGRHSEYLKKINTRGTVINGM